MSRPLSIGRLEVGVTVGPQPSTEKPNPETPFRILLFGDFSGRGLAGAQPAAAPLDRVLRVDRDHFEQVLAKLGCVIHLPLAPDTPPLALHFREMEDFHPDRLFDTLEVFQALRDLRRRLSNPATFAEAAAEMRSWGAKVAPQPAPSPPQQPEPPKPGSTEPGNLLEQVLAATPSSAPSGCRLPGAGSWQGFLHKIVEPHRVLALDTAKQAELLGLIDDTISRQMRAILHQGAFQGIEAAWRAVHFLIRRLEIGTDLQLSLVDASRTELAADLGGSEDLARTATYRLLVEQTRETSGAPPWAVVAGLYTFDQTREDAELLGRLAKVVQQAGAPFLAAASERFLPGQPEADGDGTSAWQALRSLPEARFLGLALPRFLLRLPYGAKGASTERFDLTEMPEGSDHPRYLWGNPAIACVYLLAQAFARHGWGLRPGSVQDVEDLPLHVYSDSGESVMKPCAERWLTQREAEALLENGLMPLLSVQGRPVVRLARFQSLADPIQPLAGPWQP
jgi:type VI secretion system protein ImpC